ncbi:MAG TPA: argininosuccinate lyase [Planctomycetota bacterium]|nr:argininosuccinate lyase [Planctomycetota bacterium]
MKTKKASKKLWGGAFEGSADKRLEAFTESVSFDACLAQYDIAGSVAHARMLAKCGLISAAEAAQIVRGLEGIGREIAAGKFKWKRELEDVHMNIESALTARIGRAAGKLHTARSRNDQVALDMRLWGRDAIDQVCARIEAAQRALVEKAAGLTKAVMPGYTHLQRAMPVSAAHHLLAYVEMFARDRERLIETRARVNQMPLGACALAGTSLPIDRQFVANALKFDSVMANSMDAVATRDHLVELAQNLTLVGLTLSRLGEDIVLWASREFCFVKIADSFTTGSSMMPQKRNPDIAELLRGKVGRIAAAAQALWLQTKGLPLTYNRDLQDDKILLFEAVKVVEDSLAILAAMVPAMAFDPERMADSCYGYMDATILAEFLVVRGVPFREAHRVIGGLVRTAEEFPCELNDLADQVFYEAHPAFKTKRKPARRGARVEPEFREVLGAAGALTAYRSEGSPHPEKVAARVRYWRKALKR